MLADRAMLSIDMSKLEMVKELALEINYDIVIISSWRNIEYYSFIEEKLKERGLQVVGRIEDEINEGCVTRYDRGMGIRNYIVSNNVSNYIILDDETRDYDEILLSRLVQTDYMVGLSTKDIKKVVDMLGVKNTQK